MIFISFLSILIICLLFRSLFVRAAEKELRKCRNVRISTDGVEIFAEAESLEYCIRAAILLGEKTTVFVAESDEESAYIAEAMQKYYDFQIIYTS